MNENKTIGEYINMLPQKDLSKLPKAWVLTKVGEICSCEKNKGQEGAIPYLEIGNINILTKKYFPGGKPAVRGAFLSKKGDILISRVRPTRGAVVITLEEELHVSSALTVLRPLGGIPSKFLHYFLAWNQTFFKFLGENSTGTMYPTVKEEFILEYPVPLPPLPEQHRIVAKIEELFTKLDAGVSLLEKIRLQLKRYRQAVLRDAFEGKLTEEWREALKGEMEPASVLLERIKEERKKNANWKKGKYEELPPVDTSELPELPEGWVYLTLNYLVSNDRNSIKRGPFGSAIKKAFFVPYGYKVYEQGNVIYSDFQRGGYFIDDKKFDEMKGFQIKPGDVLMTCSGTVGRIAIVPQGIQPGIINQALLKITLNNKVVNTPYFVYLFRSRIDEIILENTRGSAMLNISSVEDLRQIPLAIPSLAEQQKIVEEIERRLSIADEVEKTVEQSLKQAERLRQSILKRAFEGKLVPQDPSDEPASILLERIKEEKAMTEKKTKKERSKNYKQKRLI